MVKAFLDASVLFAAAYSSTGSARDLFRLAAQEKLEIILSTEVLDETRRNLQKKAPSRADSLEQLLVLIEPTYVDSPDDALVREVETYTAQKDAPIVAAAIEARPDYLVTYDRSDLLDPPQVAEKSGLHIVTPDVVVQAVSN